MTTITTNSQSNVTTETKTIVTHNGLFTPMRRLEQHF